MVNKPEHHIPFFPLNIFLLPGEQMPLHIFEPRYRQLFNEAESENVQFGLPFEDANLKRGYVSICRLLEVSKRYTTGELDVIIESLTIGKLKSFESAYPSKLYPGGVVINEKDSYLNTTPIDEVSEAFEKYISLIEGKMPLDVTDFRLVDIAASLKLSSTDKIKLIDTENVDKQNSILLRNLRYMNLLLDQEKSIENGFILN